MFTKEDLNKYSTKELKKLYKEHYDDLITRRVIDDMIHEREINDSFLVKKHGLTQEQIDEKERIEKLIQRPLKKDKSIKRVEICILGWEMPKVEAECLKRIIEKTKHPYKITYWDNRPDSYKGCNTAKIWNKLIEQATCEYVLIMDTDAFVETEGWLGKLVDAFESKKNTAIVAPSSESGACLVQQEYARTKTFMEIEGHVSGYCWMTSKKMFKKIGSFDERYYVWGQDSDWMNRILALKYPILVHQGVLVRHGKGGEKFSLSTTEAKKRYRFSWAEDAHYANLLTLKKRAEYNQGEFKHAEWRI